MLVGRCCSELSGHMAIEDDDRAREDDPVTIKCAGEIKFPGWVVEKLRTASAQDDGFAEGLKHI